MSREDEARRRIAAVHEACRAGAPPPGFAPEVLDLLRAAVGSDAMRLYQLAEGTIVEAYLGGLSDMEAARVAVDGWQRTNAWVIEVTGAPMLPLAATGMYPPK